MGVPEVTLVSFDYSVYLSRQQVKVTNNVCLETSKTTPSKTRKEVTTNKIQEKS